MAAEVGASAGAQQQIALPPEGADISNIQDEDLLRRMWQATEDFGRKREIRARMYKLRERRLKEFYTTGEVLKDLMSTTLDGSSETTDMSATGGAVTTVTTKRTTYAASESGDSIGGGGLVVTTTETIRGGGGSQESLLIRYRSGGNEDENLKNIEMDRRQLQGSSELIYETGGKMTRSSRSQMSSSNSQSMITKSANYGSHSQSLADQGFLTMKSKEIRDSESPTRDFIPTRQITHTRGGPAGGGGYWYEETRSYHSGDDGTDAVQFGSRGGQQQAYTAVTEYGGDGNTIITRRTGDSVVTSGHKEEVSSSTKMEEKSSHQEFSSSSSYSYSSGNKSTQEWVQKHHEGESFGSQQGNLMQIESGKRVMEDDKKENVVEERISRETRESSVDKSTRCKDHVDIKTEKVIEKSEQEIRMGNDEMECRKTERIEEKEIKEDVSRGPKQKVTQRSKTGELPLDVNTAKQQVITTTTTTTETIVDASVPSTAASTPAPDSGPAPDGANWTVVSGKQNGVCSSTDEFVFKSGASTTETKTSQDVRQTVVSDDYSTSRQDRNVTETIKTTSSSIPAGSGPVPAAGKPTPVDSPVTSPNVEVKSIMKHTTTTTTNSTPQQPSAPSNTTYYTQTKRISTEVSPTHEAFARSLRSSPEKTPSYPRAGSKTSIDTNTTILSSPTRSQKVSVTSPTGPGGAITDRPRDRSSPLKQSSPSPSASKEKRKLSSSLSRGMGTKRTATPGASPTASPVRGRSPCSDDEDKPRKRDAQTPDKKRSTPSREGSPFTDKATRTSPVKDTRPSRKTPEKSPAREIPKETSLDGSKIQRKQSESTTIETKTTSTGRRPSQGPKDDKPTVRKPSTDKLTSPSETLRKDSTPESPDKVKKIGDEKKGPSSPQRPKDLDLKSHPATEATPKSPRKDSTPSEVTAPVSHGLSDKNQPKDGKEPRITTPSDKKPLQPILKASTVDEVFDVVCEVLPEAPIVKIISPTEPSKPKPSPNELPSEETKMTDERKKTTESKTTAEKIETSAVDELTTVKDTKARTILDEMQVKDAYQRDRSESPDTRPSRKESSPMRESPARDIESTRSPKYRSPTRESPARESPYGGSPVRRSPARDSPIRDSDRSVSPSPTRGKPQASSPSRKSPMREQPDGVVKRHSSPTSVKDKPHSRSPSRRTPEKDLPSSLKSKSPSPARDSPASPAKQPDVRKSPSATNRRSPSVEKDITSEKPLRKSPLRDSPARDIRSHSPSPAKDSPKTFSPSPSRPQTGDKTPAKDQKTGRSPSTMSPSRKSPARDIPSKSTARPSPDRESPCRRHRDIATPEMSPSRKISRKESPSIESPSRKTPERDVVRKSPARDVNEAPSRKTSEPRSSLSRKPSEKENVLAKRDSTARRSQSSEIPASKRPSPFKDSPKADDTPKSKTPASEAPSRKSPPKESSPRKIPQYTSPSRLPKTSTDTHKVVSPASNRPTGDLPSPDKPWRQQPSHKGHAKEPHSPDCQVKTPVKEYPPSGIPRTMSPARKPRDYSPASPDSPKSREFKPPCTAVLYDKEPAAQRPSRSPEKGGRKPSHESVQKGPEKPISKIPGRTPSSGTPPTTRKQPTSSSIPSYQSPLRRGPRDESSPSPTTDTKTKVDDYPSRVPEGEGLRRPGSSPGGQVFEPSVGAVKTIRKTRNNKQKKRPIDGTDTSENEEDLSTTESENDEEFIEEKVIVTEKETRRVNGVLMQDIALQRYDMPNSGVPERPISLSLITTTTKTTTSGGEMLQTIDSDGKITTTTIHQPTTTTVSMSCTNRDIEGHEDFVTRTITKTSYPDRPDEDEDVEIMEIDDGGVPIPAIEYPKDTTKRPKKADLTKPNKDAPRRIGAQPMTSRPEPKKQIPTSIGRKPVNGEPAKRKMPTAATPSPKSTTVRKSLPAKSGTIPASPHTGQTPEKSSPKSTRTSGQVSRLPSKQLPRMDSKTVTSTTGKTVMQQQKMTSVTSSTTSASTRQQTNRITSTVHKIGQPRQPIRGEPLVGCIAKKPAPKGKIPQKTGSKVPLKDSKPAMPSKRAPYTNEPDDELDTDEEVYEDGETPIPSDVEIIDKYDSTDDVENFTSGKYIAETTASTKETLVTSVEKSATLHPSSSVSTPTGMPMTTEIRPISRESTPDTQGKRQPRYADRVSEPDDDDAYYEEKGISRTLRVDQETLKRDQVEKTIHVTIPRLETVEQKYADEEELEEFERTDVERRRNIRTEQVTDLDEEEPKPLEEDDDIEPANLSVSSKVSRFLAASATAAAPPQPSHAPKASEPRRTPRTSWEPENDSPKQPKTDEVDQKTYKTTEDAASYAVKRARDIFETIAKTPDAAQPPNSPKLKTDVLGKASLFEVKQTEEVHQRRTNQKVLRKSFHESDDSMGDDGLPKEKPRTIYTDSEEDYDDEDFSQVKESPIKKTLAHEPIKPTKLESEKETPSQNYRTNVEKPKYKEPSPVRTFKPQSEKLEPMEPISKPEYSYDKEEPVKDTDEDSMSDEESPEKAPEIQTTPKSSRPKQTDTDATRRRNKLPESGPSEDEQTPKVKKTSVGSTMGREAFLKRMSKFVSTEEEKSKPVRPAGETPRVKPINKFPIGSSPRKDGPEQAKVPRKDRESPSRKLPTDSGVRRVSRDEPDESRRSPARDLHSGSSDTFTRRSSKDYSRGDIESPRRTPTREVTTQKVETSRRMSEERRVNTETFTRRTSKEIRRGDTPTRETEPQKKQPDGRRPSTDTFTRRTSKDRIREDELPKRPEEDRPRGTDTFTRRPRKEQPDDDFSPRRPTDSRESPKRDTPRRESVELQRRDSPRREVDEIPKGTGTFTRKKSTDRVKEMSPSPRSSPTRDTCTRRHGTDEPKTPGQDRPSEDKRRGSDTFTRRRSQPVDEEPQKTPSAVDALKPYLRTRNQDFPGSDEDKLKPDDKKPKKLSSSRFDTFTKRDSSTTIGLERTPNKLSGSRFETFTKRDSSNAVKVTDSVVSRAKTASVTSTSTSTTTTRKSVERDVETRTKVVKEEKVASRTTPGQRESPARTDRRTPERVDRKTPERTDRRTPDRRDESPADFGEPVRKKPTKDLEDEPVKKAPRPEEEEVEVRSSSRRRPSKEGSPRPTADSPQRKPDDEIPDQQRRRSSGGKFGVVLRQTSSVGSRVEALMSKVEKKATAITSTVVLTPTRRRSSKGPEPGVEIEEIFDLELLEHMLEKATDYDQRRRIRAQIRIVRRGDVKETTQGTPRDTSTPTRPSTLVQTKSPRTPSTAPVQQPKEPSPAPEDVEDGRRRKTSRRGSSQPRESPEKEKIQPTVSRGKPSRAEEVGGELTSPSVVAKLLPSAGTPSSPAPSRPSAPTSTVPKKNSLTSTSSGLPREACPTDSITSSYGVGPTDESGRPLFGLRALRRPQQQAPDNGPSAPAPSPNTQSREASLEPRPQSPETSDIRDSSGRPLFGLRAITVSSTSKTTKEVGRATRRSESPEARVRPASSESPSEDEGVDSQRKEMPSTSATMTETSVQLRDLVRKHELHARGNTPSQPAQFQKPRAKLRDSFILPQDDEDESVVSPARPSAAEPQTGGASPASKTFPSALPSSLTESGKVIAERSCTLKSIIQKHENIVDAEQKNNKLNRRDSGLGAYTEEEDLAPAKNNYHSRAQDYSTDDEDEEYDDEDYPDIDNGDRQETTTVKVTSDIVKRPGILKKPKDSEVTESSTEISSTSRSQTVTERTSGYSSVKRESTKSVEDSEDGADEEEVSPSGKRRSPKAVTGRRPSNDAGDDESPDTPSSRATYSSYTTSSSSSSVAKSGGELSERRRSSNTVPYTVEEVDDSNDGIEVIRSPSENRYTATTTTVTRRYAASNDTPKVVSTTTTVTRSSGGRPGDEEDVQETRTSLVKKKFQSTSPAPTTTPAPATGFSRVARGGSVRALSQKFQQAAAEAASGGPDSPSRAYPKAGLIFRTASFRQHGYQPSTPKTPTHSSSSPAIPYAMAANGHSGTKTVSGEVVERRTVTSSVTRGVSAKEDTSGEYVEDVRRRSVENDRSSPYSRKSAAGDMVSSVSSTSSSRVRQTSEDGDDEEYRGGGDMVTVEQRTVVVTNGTNSSGTHGRSFLGNQTKVTGVQDVLSRMREADKEGPAEGDTVEDSEARALLNKFLGAQVILQGMEPLINAQSPSLVRQVEKQRVQKKQETVTAVYTADTDLDGIWDERRLQQLLESCGDYDGRRKIRARIRTVMAEQKVTAAIVAEGRLEAAERDEASGRSKALVPKQSSGDVAEMETTSTTVLRNVQGELLPLIVGQLKNSFEKRCDVVSGGEGALHHSAGLRGYNNGSSSEDEAPFDSGTESGEERKHHRRRRMQQMQQQQITLQQRATGEEEGDAEDEAEEEEEYAHVDGEFSSFMEGLKTSIEEAAARRRRERAPGDGEDSEGPSVSKVKGDKKKDGADEELLGEVQKALDKLQGTLQSAGNLDPEKGQALISLVSRLQTSLSQQQKQNQKEVKPEVIPPPAAPPPRSSVPDWKARNQRKRQGRSHTVGVTWEDLADARRLLDQNQQGEGDELKGEEEREKTEVEGKVGELDEKSTSVENKSYSVMRQSSAGDLAQPSWATNSLAARVFRPVHFEPQHFPPWVSMFNKTAKPFQREALGKTPPQKTPPPTVTKYPIQPPPLPAPPADPQLVSVGTKASKVSEGPKTNGDSFSPKNISESSDYSPVDGTPKLPQSPLASKVSAPFSQPGNYASNANVVQSQQPAYYPPPTAQTYRPIPPHIQNTMSATNGLSHRDSESSLTGSTSTRTETDEEEENKEECSISKGNVVLVKNPNSQVNGKRVGEGEDDDEDTEDDDEDEEDENESEVVTQKELIVNGATSNGGMTMEPKLATVYYPPSDKRPVHHSLSLDSATTKERLSVREGEGGETITRASPLARSWTLDDPSALLFTPAESVQIAVHKAAIKKQLSYEEDQRIKVPRKFNSGLEKTNLSEGSMLVKEEEVSEVPEVTNGKLEYSPVIAREASASRSGSYLSDSMREGRTASGAVSRTTSGSSVSSSASSRNSTGQANAIYGANERGENKNPPVVPPRRESIQSTPSYANSSQQIGGGSNTNKSSSQGNMNNNNNNSSMWNQNQRPINNINIQSGKENFNQNAYNLVPRTNEIKEQAKNDGREAEGSLSPFDPNISSNESQAARIQNKMEKKKKMKRANTIDIPKPLNFYVDEDDYSSGDENEDNEMGNQQGDGSMGIGTHRAAYLALRGPIRVKIPDNEKQSLAPSFQAKTESDRKFLAFLEQHSGTAATRAEPAYHSSARGGAHWSNRFSNIKTTFEGTGRGSDPHGSGRGRGTGRGSIGGNVSGPVSARNFWRAADDSVTRTKSSSHDPRLSREGSSLLRRLFEERDAANQNQANLPNKEEPKRRSSEQITKLPWVEDQQYKGDVVAKDNIVIGSLTVANKKQLFSAIKASPPSPEVKGPVPVGKFSHAPLSAFRPIPSKEQSTPSSNNSVPLSSPGAVRQASQKFSIPSSSPSGASHSAVKTQGNPSTPRLGNKSPSNQKLVFAPTQEYNSPTAGPPPWAKEDAHERVMYSTARFETLSKEPSPPPQVSYSSHAHVIHSHNAYPLPSNNATQQFAAVQPTPKYSTQTQSMDHSYGAQPRGMPQSYAPPPPPRSNAPKSTTVQQPTQVKQHLQEKPKPPPRPYSPPTRSQPSQPPLKYPLPPPPIVPPFPVPHIEPPSPEPQLQCAAVSRVMAAPTFQQAVVQKRRRGGNGEEEEEDERGSAAKNLSSALHRLSVSPACQPSKNIPPSPPKPTDNYEHDNRLEGSDLVQHSVESHLHPYYIPPFKENGQNVQRPEESPAMEYIGYSQTESVAHPSVQGWDDRQPEKQKVVDQDEFYRKQLLAVEQANRAQRRLQEAQNESLSRSSSSPYSPIPGYQSPKTHKLQHASLTSDTRELNDESVVTMRLQIPVKEPERYASDRDTMSLSPIHKGAVRSSSYHDVWRTVTSVPLSEERRPSPRRDIDDRSPTSVLQKSESWHLLNQMGSSNPSSRRPQSLSLDQSKRRVPTSLPKMSFPKQFEARLSPETVEAKQKKVEAYLKGQGTGTPPLPRRKIQVQEPLTPFLLDDNLENVDEAFESLFNAATTAQDKRVSGERIESMASSSKSSQKGLQKSQSHQHLLRPPAPPRESSSSPQFQRKQQAWEESSMVKTKLAQNLAGSHSEATTTSSSTESSVTKTEVHTKTSNYSATVTGKSRVSKAPPTKTMSPFAKFKQLDEQNAGSAPNSPKSPGGTGPLFKFTDPQLSRSASGVKDRLLYWCQMKTKEYKNIQIENFSTSWSNGLAFCALIHHFCPEAFDYDTLRPEDRRKNFELAFQVADDKAGIAPLLDVEDMVMMRKPDWKCVFTYVQSIYRRFKDED